MVAKKYGNIVDEILDNESLSRRDQGYINNRDFEQKSDIICRGRPIT